MTAKEIVDDIQMRYGIPEDYKATVEKRINDLVREIKYALNGKLETKQKSFGHSLVPYIGNKAGQYSAKMIREFYDYWSEPNKSKTKLRWEGESYWALERRLKTWANNNFDKKSQGNDAPVEKTRERI